MKASLEMYNKKINLQSKVIVVNLSTNLLQKLFTMIIKSIELQIFQRKRKTVLFKCKICD